jgi:cytochrome c oxidase subunit II
VTKLETSKHFWHVVDVYWPIGTAVFVLVAGSLLFAALRFRAREPAFPGGRSEWPLAEYVYVAIIAAIVVMLLTVTYSALGSRTPRGAETIRVTAAQWSWSFGYPGGVSVRGTSQRIPTLVVPAGRPVHFEVTSIDVVHAFWIVDRRFKVDAFPRRTTTANLVWPKPGSWREGGTCNQYCGLDHTRMVFNVLALPGSAYDRWLAGRRT